MTVEQVRRLYEAQPFQPFTLHLADGRQISVHHREFLALSPSGRTVIVYQPDDAYDIIDVSLVADLVTQADGISADREGK